VTRPVSGASISSAVSTNSGARLNQGCPVETAGPPKAG